MWILSGLLLWRKWYIRKAVHVSSFFFFAQREKAAVLQNIDSVHAPVCKKKSKLIENRWFCNFSWNVIEIINLPTAWSGYLESGMINAMIYFLFCIWKNYLTSSWLRLLTDFQDYFLQRGLSAFQGIPFSTGKVFLSCSINIEYRNAYCTPVCSNFYLVSSLVKTVLLSPVGRTTSWHLLVSAPIE